MIVADSGGQLDFRRELFSDGLGSVSALLADYSLRVGMAGYRSVVVVSNSGPTERWLPEEIFLERGGTVHGRLVDADGFAVPDGKTEFSLIGKTRVEVRDVEFRPNGAYSFISPVAGRYRLDVLHLCAGRGVSEELDLDPKRNQVVPDLVITGPAELVGRVVDLAWQPVAGLVVEAFSEDLSLEGVGTQHGEAVSAADGSFRFRGLAGERYEITTSEDMVEELVGITPGAVPVLLQINETRVSVEVLSAAGVPVPGSMVRAESFSPDEEVAWSEDWEVLRKDGRVDLLLPPGEYSIYAYSEGAVSARRAVFVREGQAVGTVPLSLQRIGVGGFVVWLSDYRGRGISILDVHVREIRGVEPEEWSVDGDGAKQVGVQGLSAGMYEVTIRPEATEWEGSVCQFQPTHTEVEILDGQVTEVRRVVREGGSVMIQINGIPPSPGGMGRWNPGVQWVPEGGDPIDLKYFLPGAIPAPGSPPPQFEIWSFDDVLPTGRGTLRIPTASGVRSVQASLYPSRTARITIPWAG